MVFDSTAVAVHCNVHILTLSTIVIKPSSMIDCKHHKPCGASPTVGEDVSENLPSKPCILLDLLDVPGCTVCTFINGLPNTGVHCLVCHLGTLQSHITTGMYQRISHVSL